MKTIKPRSELKLHPCATINWQTKNIPTELQDMPQWKLCYPINTFIDGILVTTSKRPIGGPRLTGTEPKLYDLAFTPADSIQEVQHFGFCFTEFDDVVGIDVDSLPEHFTFADLPESIQAILRHYPTYAEVSPSGQGLHIFYRMNKALLAHRAAADKGVIDFNGAVYIRNQFMTFTGHAFPPSKPQQQLALVEASVFEKLVLKPTNIIPLPTPVALQQQPQLREPPPSMTDLENWLSEIPPSLSTSPLKNRFYDIYRTFNPPMECPSDYDHWRIIAAAVHHGATLSGQIKEGAALFDDWSSRDLINYESSEAAVKKYYDNPPSFDGKDIGFKTLIALAKAAIPDYPERAGTKAVPLPNNVQNFMCHINHFGLSLAMNEITKEIMAVGNEALVEKHFKGVLTRPDLETCVMSMCHNNTIFRVIGSSTAASFARAMARSNMKMFNPIKKWIDEAPAFNPKSKHSYFDELFNTLTVPKHEQRNLWLYKIYLKKALMGIIRAHYYTGRWSSTTGIIILQGPESTFKSSWIVTLLPQELRRYIFSSQASLNNSTNVKEIQLEAGTCQIWLRDEVEALLKSGDAALKNLLVQETDSYRPLYGTTPVSVPRKCIFFGTTNVRELPITDDGSRRIQIIPVEFCDAAVLANMDIVMVYKELLWEFQETLKARPNKVHELWSLTPEEIAETNRINSTERKADQDADSLIKSCYWCNAPYKDSAFTARTGNGDRTKLTPSIDVMNVIKTLTGVSVSPNALKHALHRVCGQWTGTSTKPRYIGDVKIDRGRASKKKADGKSDVFSGWLMPPLMSEKPEDEE
jgi:hypothetical protein